MSKKIKISVIITTYNREKFIVECVKSVLQQTFTDFEVIIIDDGSQDNTQNLLVEFSDIKNLKYIYQENQERAKSRNNGVKIARGEYLMFLDADDTLLPNALNDLYDGAIKNKEAGLIAGLVEFIDEEGAKINFIDKWQQTVFDAKYGNVRKIGLMQKIFGSKPVLYWQASPESCRIIEKDAYLDLIKGEHIFIGSFLVKKELLEITNGFDPEMVPVEDTDFEYRVSLLTKFAFIKKNVSQIRRHENNTASERFQDATVKLYKKHLKLLKNENTNTSIRIIRRKAKSVILFRLGNIYYAKKRNIDALIQYYNSIYYLPKKIFEWYFIIQVIKAIINK